MYAGIFTDFFSVLKTSSGKLRLVNDYRSLNKVLARPDWQFLLSEVVRSRIYPEARVFGTLDLTSRYNQIPLSKDYCNLTTFTLPFGNY